MKIYSIKYCVQCGAVIVKGKNRSIAEYNKRKFCKIQCQHKYNTEHNTTLIRCDFCGKEIRKRNSSIKEHNFCSPICAGKYNTKMNTRKVTCEWCGKEFNKRLSNRKMNKTFCSSRCLGKWQSKFLVGENSYGWKGGISTTSHNIRSLVKYKNWVHNVFERDGYTCQKCGDKKGGNLNAHHIKQLSDIIKDNKIKDIIEASECKELWNIENGITLCKKCHIETHKKKAK